MSFLAKVLGPYNHIGESVDASFMIPFGFTFDKPLVKRIDKHTDGQKFELERVMR
jgi:hypothetical protein